MRRALLVFLLCPCIVSGSGLCAPEDPAAYYQDLRVAHDHMRNQRWDEAEPLYTRLAGAYPENGSTWARLGSCRYQQGRYRDAAEAYEEAVLHGAVFPFNTIFNIACCYALVEETDLAFAWLERALEAGFESRGNLLTDSDLNSLHDDPRWADLAGVVDRDALEHTEGWRIDLDFLMEEIARIHPDPYRVHDRADFEKAASALREDIPRLDDERIWFRMQQIVTMLGDGHSGVLPSPFSRVRATALPLRLYRFSDGLFVIDAEAPHEPLIGARILGIGGTSIGELVTGLEAVVPRDNPMGILNFGPFFLTLSQVLVNLGVEETDAGFALSVELPDGGTRTEVVAPGPFRLRIGPMADWLESESDLPLYLKRESENYWFEPLEESGAVFVQFNSVRNAPAETLEDFAARLQQHLLDHPVENVILDIRHNGGGNSFLYPPLVRALVTYESLNPDAGLYVLTGRQTFSAGQNFATDLDTWSRAVFAGEPTGSRPNHIGESNTAFLPYSGLQLGISSRFHQQSYPGDARPFIAPEIPVALTSEDYFARRDPVLEAVLEVIATKP